MKKWITASLVAMLLTSCASVKEGGPLDSLADRIIGPAETVQQRVFRGCSVSLLMAERILLYKEDPLSMERVGMRLVQLEGISYRACRNAELIAKIPGAEEDAVSVLFSTMAGAIEGTVFALLTQDEKSAPSVKTTVTSVLLRAASILIEVPQLRMELAEVKAVLSDMSMSKRNPSDDEWKLLLTRLDETHLKVEG